MNTEDIPTKPVTMWLPERDPLLLGITGKMGEEASELSQRCHRIAIQGFNEIDPDKHKTNRVLLEEEIADLRAIIAHYDHQVGIDAPTENERYNRKLAYKAPWIQWLRDLAFVSGFRHPKE